MKKTKQKKFTGIYELLRVHQYYKNLIIFVGLFFAGELGNFSLYPKLFIGFLVLSMTSSIVYILNDLRDIEADKLHPEKKESRPLASGLISPLIAWIMVTFLFVLVLIAVIYYRNLFSVMISLVLFNGLVYNYILKDIAFADVISLSTMYIWRALAGCAIIDVSISSWLTITVFLTALLLATGKRIADLSLLGEKDAISHKKAYASYTPDLLDKLLIVTATSLFVTYTLYCVLGPLETDSFAAKGQGILTYSIPIALFLIFRFIYIVKEKPELSRKAHKIVLDKGMVIGGILLSGFVLGVLYLNLDGGLF
ncbi:MAG: UbiA prenyltransferase family protein [Promethearchaeota archaeon]